MLRCAASLVIAAYAQVGLIPRDLRALPLELFTRSSEIVPFVTFY
jgi:hypothetical protein